MKSPAPILLAVCGNALAADDAFGPLVASHLAAEPPPSTLARHLDIVDLATNPSALLDHLPGRRALIVVDAAIAPDLPLGELLDLDYFSPDRPPLLSDRPLTTHALDLPSQLALARTLGLLPRHIRLLALTISPPPSSPSQLGRSMSPCAKAQIPAVVRKILDWSAYYASLPA